LCGSGLPDIAVLDEPDDGIWQHVHFFGLRTSGGTLSALVAIGNFCVGECLDLGNFGILILAVQGNFSCLTK
jgi:hypothetical protein